MKQKTYWKDILQSFRLSIARVISIVSLMALGSFALVGLKVSVPTIQSAGENYFKTYQTADLFVLGEYGLSKDDVTLLKTLEDKATVEFGYLQDVEIEHTKQAVRIVSLTPHVSGYEVIDGRLPQQEQEIALTATYAPHYQLGGMITFSTKDKDTSLLKDYTFKIVGFVYSTEMVSRSNLGNSSTGTGILDGYAVVTPEAFDSKVYSIARLSYHQLQESNPYSKIYANQLSKEKNELIHLLKKQPTHRLEALKKEGQEDIENGEQQLQDAKEQLQAAKKQLFETKDLLQEKKEQLEQAKQTILQAKEQIEIGYQTVLFQEAELDNGGKTLEDSRQTLEQAGSELLAAQQQLADGKQTLAQQQSELEEKKAQLQQGKTQLDTTLQMLEQKERELESARALIAQLSEQGVDTTELELAVQLGTQQYKEGKELYDTQLNVYTMSLEKWQEGKRLLANARSVLAEKETLYHQQRALYESGKTEWSIHKKLYEEGQADLKKGKQELTDRTIELEQAEEDIKQNEQQLQHALESFEQKQTEFNEEEQKAQQKIERNEQTLLDAKDQITQLKEPFYRVYSRRDAPGSHGYVSYQSNVETIDNVANIFPVALYFVAALVTFTTMTRFVDEERIKAGTLKALGYTDWDIIKKFVMYGLLTSFLGTTIGVIMGHLLLPNIIYNTYAQTLTMPSLTIRFHKEITALAYGLALLSAVVPAYIVSKKELSEKPAFLLLPKPPVAGANIWLEKIKPLWRRLSFTQKVTARNIFRYKQRMLMTIFGVCGSVALLFSGLGMKDSIASLNTLQFEDIIHYDLMVAKQQTTKEAQQKELDSLLTNDKVAAYLPVQFEEVTRVLGSKQDTQTLSVIAIEEDKADVLAEYIELKDIQSNNFLDIGKTGAIVSEKLAVLSQAKIGDTLTVQDVNGNNRQVVISGITKMYTGHFLFMNRTTYEHMFQKEFEKSAWLVKATDNSAETVQTLASHFMRSSAVTGVVQNTTLKQFIDTIVKALGSVMYTMIISSVLLAVVILYNLTNINVAERIRELSTIKVLGFYDREVTLYIYRETMLLSIIGIVLGFIFGSLLHQYMIAIIPPDSVLFSTQVSMSVYLFPFLSVTLILIVLGYSVHRRLKKINMLKALKSVE